jgi:hypothetical protein
MSALARHVDDTAVFPPSVIRGLGYDRVQQVCDCPTGEIEYGRLLLFRQNRLDTDGTPSFCAIW